MNPAASQDGPAVLGYATPAADRPPPPVVAYRLSVACGAIPLVVGTVALIGYLATKNDLFVGLGLTTLVLGTISFFLGVAALCVYAWRAWQVRRLRERTVLVRVVLAALLLLANWPVAYAFAGVGGDAVVDDMPD